MSKAVVLVILGFTAIFEQGQTITCPIEDENSQATYYPHETECGKFYECVAGTAKLLECPEGLYWNQRLNVCDWDVNCGNLLTSTLYPGATTTTTTPNPPPDDPTSAPDS